ncbi:MAG: Rieske 2Fe-2S domain-containing protein, partial [Planctomycetota bacterium]
MPVDEKDNSCITRRSFLKLLLSKFAAFSVIFIFFTVLIKKFFRSPVFYQKATSFKAGLPFDYHPNKADERYKGSHGVFIVRTSQEEGNYLYALSAKCTHLGCMINYNRLGSEFTCPCHGSRYKKDGVNFSGPAPRPLDLVHIELAEDGQIILDKSIIAKRKNTK